MSDTVLNLPWCDVTLGEDGWIRGKVTGLAGQRYRIERHEIPRPGGQPYLRLVGTPAFILHTTEGDSGPTDPNDFDDALARFRRESSPPQWLVGESRIGQLRPVWAQGAAMRTRDPHTGELTFNANPFVMQVETVENSSEELGIFKPEAQDPLVALAAMLDALGLVKTLQRPRGWPDKLDRPDGINPSSYDYWRRKKALIPEGDFCGGHVDIRGNTHWDPGSFEYPTFIAQVRELQGEGDFMALFETREDFEAYLAKKLPRIIRGAIAGEDAGGKPKFQAIEGDRVTEFIVGMDEAMRGRGATRPTESGPRQRGFDLAVLLTTRGRRRQPDMDEDVVVPPADVIVEPE